MYYVEYPVKGILKKFPFDSLKKASISFKRAFAREIEVYLWCDDKIIQAVNY